MRILMVADGQSIHTRRWVRGLADRGHALLVASDRVCPERGIEQARLPALKAGRRNLPALVKALSRAARGFRPHLVHAHYASHYGFLAALAGLRPLVISIWGADVEVFPRRGPINRAILRWTFARAHGLTATSKYLEDISRRYCPASRPIAVIPFGVDVEQFQATSHPPRDRFMIVSNKHLEAVYGGDVLVHALARLADRPIDAVILGEGGFRPALEDLIRHQGLSDRIRLPGAVGVDAVCAALANADLAVYPSRRESFGVATLEASAMSLPVVATRVGGLPEVVQDGVTGLLVGVEDVDALASAIDVLVEDPVRRQAMGRAGAEFVRQRFGWPNSLDRMESFYTKISGGD